MRVILLDVKTGEEREYPDQSISRFGWEEGNWSCDCNRVIAWAPIDWSKYNGMCDGCQRYIVIAASEGDFDDLNECYPDYAKDPWRAKFRRIDG